MKFLKIRTEIKLFEKSEFWKLFKKWFVKIELWHVRINNKKNKSTCASKMAHQRWPCIESFYAFKMTCRNSSNWGLGCLIRSRCCWISKIQWLIWARTLSTFYNKGFSNIVLSLPVLVFSPWGLPWFLIIFPMSTVCSYHNWTHILKGIIYS